MSPRTRLALSSVALVVVASWFVAPRLLGALAPHLYAGTVLQGDEPAPAMAGLADGAGDEIVVGGGDLLLVYFGYTHCPDVCPTTLATVAEARRRLADDAAAVDLVMVGVDPGRDSAAELDDYVAFFDPSFRAVTGPEAAVAEVASAYGVFYELGAADADGAYTVDHTATLMGIDGDGVLRIVWPPDVGAEALAADLAELLG